MKRLPSGAWAGSLRKRPLFSKARSEAGHPGQQAVVRECLLELQVPRRWMKAVVVGRRDQKMGRGGSCGMGKWGRGIED